jgi:LPXTG-site transpeptidase (sortase) family protein
MNQILITKKYIYKSRKKRIRFKLQFYISAILFIILTTVFSTLTYSKSKNEEISKELLDSFSNSLYANYQNDIISKVNNNSFVIGIIEIEKIKLNYPILSTQSKELLEISPCRFAGPLPNNVGNLCIAGHNYADKRFFGRLKELSLNDKISIYDLSGKKLDYIIYEKREILSTDLSCTSQETNGNIIVTLITCNNISGKRLQIKAKVL